MYNMSWKCVENWRGQLADCIDSLHDIQQLLFSGHVISDSNSFADLLNKLRGIAADLSRVVVARTDCTASSSTSEMIDLRNSKDDVDEFDSMLCDMNDEEFDSAVNSQLPLMIATDDGVVNNQSLMTTDVPPCNVSIPSPCQHHVDKLKQVFGHSQFKLLVIMIFIITNVGNYDM